MSKRRSGPDLREGDVLVLTSTRRDVANWGRGIQPTTLALGERFVVSSVEPHSWHTLVSVVRENGGPVLGPFNEALFTHEPDYDGVPYDHEPPTPDLAPDRRA